MRGLLIREFNLDPLNDGSYNLIWKDGSQSITINIDLHQVLRSLAYHHQAEAQMCAQTFCLAMTNADQFLTDPSHQQLLSYLPDTTLPPGQYLSGVALTLWHLKQFVVAYNRQFCTQLDSKQVSYYLDLESL